MTIKQSLTDLVDEARKAYEISQEQWPFDCGMDALYAMCRSTPEHTDIKKTVSKLWLIGRSYAAALERRSDVEKYADDPYHPTAQKLKDRGFVDVILNDVRRAKPYTETHLDLVAELVARLTRVFEETTGLRKVSLATKYLHFHEPTIPIFDNINSTVLRRFVRKEDVHEDLLRLWNSGEGYERHLARFVTTMWRLQEEGFDTDAKKLDAFLLHIGGYFQRP